jgi:hypothetical protein
MSGKKCSSVRYRVSGSSQEAKRLADLADGIPLGLYPSGDTLEDKGDSKYIVWFESTGLDSATIRVTSHHRALTTERIKFNDEYTTPKALQLEVKEMNGDRMILEVSLNPEFAEYASDKFGLKPFERPPYNFLEIPIPLETEFYDPDNETGKELDTQTG